MLSGLTLPLPELQALQLPVLRDIVPEDEPEDAGVLAVAGVLADVGADGDAPALLDAGLLLLEAELPLLPPAAPEEDPPPDLSTPP